MNYINKYVTGLLLLLISMCSYAQNYPGGINTGQVKGWRAEAYWGHAINNNPALFGQGTANAIGELWGFTDYINGNEFTAIRGDNFSVEYTATLNITTAGVYQFRLSSVDDYTWLYIDGVQVAFANTAGAGTNSGYQSINLSAGEHAIKVKFSEGGGAQNFDINWQGNGIPANTRLDARYVYIKDVPMSHWLNLDGAITTTVGGSQRIQRITNKAANGTNQEMMYNGSGWTGLFETENVNFNGVSRHSGDDHFRIYNSSNTLGKRYTNGLVLRGTPYTHLLSASHHTSPESASLLIGYGRSCGTNSTRSFYKTNTYISHDVYDIRTTTPFTFKTNEPYVVNGWSEYTATAQSNFHVALNTASSQGVLNNVTTANLTTSLNGLQTLVCNTGANNFSFQEYIYYPFQLDATQLKKVNTYMAIKWGTNFSQNWIAPNNTIVWDKEGTANTGYQNRVFGIAADASNGNLNQKQSQSQVRTAEADYQNTYLTISKGAIATSNTTNTATIPDGSYLLVGDNGAVLTNQSNDIPSSFSGCIFGRIAREWKARVTGTPGAVTLRAGSNNAGSAVFSGNATGIQLMIDEDGNGNFTNGTIRTYNYTSLVNGIATFENVTLNDGEVFTFVYKIIAPGGVSRPTAGTLIGSDTYVNGLEYKLYSGFNTTPENGMTGVLLSSGYTNSDFNFDDNVETKIGDNFQLQLTGKIQIQTAGNYSFRFQNLDDEASVHINGVLVHFGNCCGTTAGGTITLTAGYHDIDIRFSESGGVNTLQMQYSGPDNGSTWGQVPDNRYFVLPFGPSAWFSTTAGSFDGFADGAAISNGTIWRDLSLYGNNLTLTQGDPVFKKTSNLRNYNQQLRFDDDRFSNTGYLNGFAYGRQGKTNFSVQGFSSTTASEEVLFGWGIGTTGGLQGIFTNNLGNIIYFGFGSDYNLGTAHFTGTYKHSIVNTMYRNFGISSTNNGFGFVDNRQTGNLTINNWNTRFAPSVQYQIGNDYTSPDSEGWNGDINEIINYPWDLSTNERLRVNSYLAVKWGVSIDQTTATDYIASDGQSFWNGTASSSYKWNIFGIGRDDCSGLDQRQSQSANYNTKSNLRIGLGTINETAGNSGNTTAFTNDYSFIMLGANTDNTDFTAPLSVGLPTAYTSCNAKMWKTAWKVDRTNNTQNIQLKVGQEKTFFKITKAMSNPQLAVDTDGDGNFTNATIVDYTTLAKGVATFNLSATQLPDGAVITLVWTVANPGGVTNPITGTSISGQSFVNGLEYKLYSVSNVAGSIATGFNSFSPILLSTGYINNATNFDDFLLSKISDNFGIELTGKLYVPTNTSTYQFRANVDDQFALIINGVTIIDRTTSGSVTSGNITLAAGYHDIIIRGKEQTGAEQFDLLWNGGSGSTFIAIPDNNFFTRPSGPSAWFSSDDGSFDTFTDGASITLNSIWYDLSINDNNISLVQGDPVFKKTSNLRNYNQQLRFDDDRFSNTGYLNGFAYGRQGKTNFSVQGFSSTTASEEILFGWGIGTTGGLQGIFTNNLGNIIYSGFSSDYNLGTAHFTGTYKHSIVNTMYRNFGISSTNNGFGFVDNRQTGNLTINNWNTRFAPSVQYQIGNDYTSPDSEGWNGDINEIINYPWDLSATERQRVNSYLATHWGVTLDQTTATNYLASDGSIVWNATLANQGTNGNFNVDITGIGRDDCSALLQRQSTSIDGNDIMRFGLTKIEVSNENNQNKFTADKSYLFVAHNGANYDGNTTNMPTSLNSATTCYVKLNRVWQVQKAGTGVSLPLQFSIGKAGQKTFRPNQEVKLLISSSPTDFTGATIYDASSVLGGLATFDGVTLSNGNYLAIAYINSAPGGVTNGLVRWYTAEVGTYTDTDYFYPTENENDAVQVWTDNSNYAADVNQTTLQNRPIYKKSVANFNPSLEFDGVNDNLINNVYAGLPIGSSVRTVGLLATTYNNPAPINNWPNAFSYGGGGAGRMFSITQNSNSLDSRLDNITGGVILSNGFAPANSSRLIYAKLFGATNSSMNSNLGVDANLVGGVVYNTSATDFAIGFMRSANTYFWKGSISEIFIFDRILTANEDLRIGTTHAIKYGTTLNIITNPTFTTKAYLDAQNNEVYNYTTYWNRITGIARDYCSGLDQRQSMNTEAGALVAISSDISGGIATSNLDNPVKLQPSATAASYLIFGDDNKSLAWTGERTIAKDDKTLATLARTFRASETGTVGAVHIQVSDAGGVSYNSNQATLPSHTGLVYLVVANAATNGDLMATSGVTIKMMDYIDATKSWQTTYDFTAGDYFTFASEVKCIGPAGILGNLQLWLKANDGTGQTTQGAAVTTWTDASMSGNSGTGVNNPAFQATGTGVMNYNPSVSFNGTNQYFNLPSGFNDFTAGATSFVVRKRNGNNTSNGRFFHFSAGANTNAFVLNRSAATENLRLETFNASSTVLGASFVSTNTPLSVVNPNIMGFTLQGGTSEQTGRAFKYFYNGSLNSSITTAAVPTTINRTVNRIGAGGSATEWMNGFIPELILYNTQLTDLQTQKVNTYLALKYGVTSGATYISPVFDGTTNIATETLFDVSTFGNRVFGVGIDKTGCLVQNQSKNQEGGLIAISVDGVINTLNSADETKWTNDRNYIIMGDDNKSIGSFVKAGSTGNEPVPTIYEEGCIVNRVNRHWKVQVKGDKAPNLLVSIPASTSAETVKLPALPSVGTLQSFENQKVYLVLNENADFTVDANMQEVELVFNATSQSYEATIAVNPNELPNNTFYYTIVTRVNPCREGCLKSNKNATSKYSK